MIAQGKIVAAECPENRFSALCKKACGAAAISRAATAHRSRRGGHFATTWGHNRYGVGKQQRDAATKNACPYAGQA